MRRHVSEDLEDAPFIIAGDIKDPETGQVLASDGQTLTRELLELMKEKGVLNISCIDPERVRIPVEDEEIQGRVIADDIVDPETGEVILESNQALFPDALEVLREKGILAFEVLVLSGQGVSTSIREDSPCGSSQYN